MTSLISSQSPTVSLINGKPATTSLEVARFFGKRHDHVVRDIRAIINDVPEEVRLPNFGETSNTVEMPNGGTREESMFTIHRDGFMLLVMGYTGKRAMQIKVAYIMAFNALEQELMGKPLTLTSTNSTQRTREFRERKRFAIEQEKIEATAASRLRKSYIANIELLHKMADILQIQVTGKVELFKEMTTRMLTEA